MSELHLGNLKPSNGSRTTFKRVGRGHGTGRGTTAGRGTKGQRARTGGRKGLMKWSLRRLIMSLPKKRGFKSIHKKPVNINLSDLSVFGDGVTITVSLLVEKGVIENGNNGVKVLGDGSAKKWTLKGLLVSASAKAKIEKTGVSLSI